jgi:hypothetical protein
VALISINAHRGERIASDRASADADSIQNLIFERDAFRSAFPIGGVLQSIYPVQTEASRLCLEGQGRQRNRTVLKPLAGDIKMLEPIEPGPDEIDVPTDATPLDFRSLSRHAPADATPTEGGESRVAIVHPMLTVTASARCPRALHRGWKK